MSSKNIAVEFSSQLMSSTISEKEDMQKDDYSYMFESEKIVDFGLEGMVRANKGLVLLDGYRVILRRDFRTLKQVKLMSGGCSGFEPLYTGFVGPGMLTCACVGDKSGYPSFPTILVAIRELAADNSHGVLIILENNMGVKINFGLAVEQAQSQGILVKIVLVKDDTSGLDSHRGGRKGLAGIAFVYKVAAAMAENGVCFEEIYRCCEKLGNSDLATISINILKEKSELCLESIEDMCGIACPSSSSIRGITIKKAIQVLGDVSTKETLGVYPFANKQEFANMVLKYVIRSKKDSSEYSLVLEPDEPVVLLFNNYGYIMGLEMNAIVREISNELRRRKVFVERIYVGTIMMTRNYSGFSITVMRANNECLKYLDHPTCVSGWPTIVTFLGTDLRTFIRCQCKVPDLDTEEELGPMVSDVAAAQISRVIEFVCVSLMSCEEQINKISLINQMGTYGTFIKNGADKINLALYDGRLKTRNPFALLRQLSFICSSEMGSMCGAHYGVFFDGASQVFIQYFKETEVTPKMWVQALEKGIQAIEHFGCIRRKDRTLLDALYPMLDVLKRNAESIEEAAEAAEMGSLSTINQCKKHSLPAAGAHCVAIWARALTEALNQIVYKNTPVFDDEDVVNAEDSSDEDEDDDLSNL